MILFNLNYLLKSPISKYSHIGSLVSIHKFWEDTIQSMMGGIGIKANWIIGLHQYIRDEVCGQVLHSDTACSFRMFTQSL